MNALVRTLLLIGFLIQLPLFLPDAEAGVDNVTNIELAALLEAGVTIIDIRTEKEWRETGVIPGSHTLTLFDERRRMINPDDWLKKVRAAVPMDKPVILICRVGNRTVPATKLLASAGYATVYNVTGGITAWIKAGMPVVKFAAL